MIAQINAAHFGIVAQLERSAPGHYLAMIHDVCAIRHVECFPDVMVGDENVNAGAA